MTEHTTYRILAVSKAISPITHNMGTQGNETLVQREPVHTGNGIAWVPFLSGNAIRHRMVREPGARWLIEHLRLSGKINLQSLQFLFSGGALTEGGGTERTDRVLDLWETLPLIRVLGSSLPDMIVGGTLHAWRGVLVCQENLQRIVSLLPQDWLPQGRYLPAHRFIGNYQYTRQDAAARHGDMAERGETGKPSDQMIYSGQTVNAGAVFVHGFHLRNALPRDLGALLFSLSLWNRDTQTVGGMSAKGHGRLATQIMIEPTVNQAEMIKTYAEHMDASSDRVAALLHREFEAHV